MVERDAKNGEATEVGNASSCRPCPKRGIAATVCNAGREAAGASRPVVGRDTRKPNEGLVRAKAELASTSGGGRRPPMGSAAGPEGGGVDRVELVGGFPMKASAAGTLNVFMLLCTVLQSLRCAVRQLRVQACALHDRPALIPNAVMVKARTQIHVSA